MATLDRSDALFRYLLRLGDTALVLGHRLSEWCGHGPVLEEDIALANVALDLTGQANELLTYAAEVEGRGRDADALAFLRDGFDFRNLLLAEQPNGDFGRTMVRQLLFDAHDLELQAALQGSTDSRLAAIAGKAVKEAAYHFKHSADWVIRLGDGTDESHARVAAALDALWPYTGEMFQSDDAHAALQAAGIAPDLQALRLRWRARIDAVLAEATLAAPAEGWMQAGGIAGRHSEHLGHLLATMQFLQRAYPGARW
ncbi:MAG: phenylacetate-CoA oxygenase subunit PaaC [Alphaproteobacteria bacterium]|nr:phenylacetate-CoA oxygenase subunit PaaC [Alphaproteobacteria bacterium]